MLDEVFILTLSISLALIYRWAFRVLPNEEWQIIGCFPYRKDASGLWRGWNLTWYGFFNAMAILLAVSILIVLSGATATPLVAVLFITMLILAICLPASRILASFIEKKRNTATVGGASFIGILIAPLIMLMAKVVGNQFLGYDISIITLLSAMSISYALGEGMGRLACISFGCCYGKPLKESSPFIRKIFHRYHFVFTGKSKKIAYAHQMDGQQVIPIQAATTLIYSFAGIIGCYLFLKGFALVSFVLVLTITQLWRFFSEIFRDDDRGEGRISAYQKMALISCVYGFAVAYIFNEAQRKTPDLISGLSSLWNPWLLLFMVSLGIVALIYTGKSNVTGALIEIRVQKENI
jgi:prolipoprotein diacylglyceryltransferase